MTRRIEKLAEARHLGGGLQRRRADAAPGPRRSDPLIRRRGMMAGLITNGYFLVRTHRGAEPGPGLDFLQISIDNVGPDGNVEESLRVLDRSCSTCATTRSSTSTSTRCSAAASRTPRTRGPSTAARGARLLHLHRHHPRRPRAAEAARPGERGLRRCRRRSAGRGRCSEPVLRHHELRENSPTASRTSGGAARAPSTLYVCEEGLVHHCSQRRQRRACRSSYTIDDIRREFVTPKWCAPYCTVGCVHRVSTMDFWRSPQELAVSSRQSAASRSVRLLADVRLRRTLRQSLSAESLTRTPTFIRRGVPVVDGLVCTNDTLSNMF